MLEKKLPKNPKYAHIKPNVNTGKTIKDAEVLSDGFIAKKRSEPFRRIKPSTLSKLLAVFLLYILGTN